VRSRQARGWPAVDGVGFALDVAVHVVLVAPIEPSRNGRTQSQQAGRYAPEVARQADVVQQRTAGAQTNRADRYLDCLTNRCPGSGRAGPV
jgi:hypothetical protein